MGNNTENIMNLPTMTEDITGEIFAGNDLKSEDIPSENPGEKTTLQSDNEKIENELTDLYIESEELSAERDALWAQYYGSQNKVQLLQDTLEQRQAQLNEAQIEDMKYQIREAQATLSQDLDDAQGAQNRLDEVNRRISTLETGFDTGSTEWVRE